MDKVKLFVIIALITLIEAVFSVYIKIGGIMPDLLFVFVLCYAVERYSISSTITISVICGVLADCLVGRIFGNYLAIFSISAIMMWLIKDNILKNSLIVSFILIFVFGILAKSMYFLSNISVLKEAGYLYSLFRIILPETIYNTVISFVMIPLLRLTLKKRSGLYL